MREMREKIPNVNVAYYVNMPTIEAIHRALDIPLGSGRGGDEGQDGNDECGIDEEVVSD